MPTHTKKKLKLSYRHFVLATVHKPWWLFWIWLTPKCWWVVHQDCKTLEQLAMCDIVIKYWGDYCEEKQHFLKPYFHYHLKQVRTSKQVRVSWMVQYCKLYKPIEVRHRGCSRRSLCSEFPAVSWSNIQPFGSQLGQPRGEPSRVLVMLQRKPQGSVAPYGCYWDASRGLIIQATQPGMSDVVRPETPIDPIGYITEASQHILDNYNPSSGSWTYFSNSVNSNC